MEMADSTSKSTKSWLDHVLFSIPNVNIEKLIFALILIIAVFTRFYLLEARVMSHDETSHTYFSWLFYKGDGYAHDPITHGPFQFHIVALSYFLFGDNDTTARIPAALFSIATIAFMWNYRRYLGRVGALVAALLLTISPYMLYYGRYVRNEAFVAFYGIVLFWSILRYFDTRHPRYLYIFTVVTVLHFCTKETSFIYAAQALLFLALYLVYRLALQTWEKNNFRSYFLYSLLLSVVLLSIGVVSKFLGTKSSIAGDPLYPFFASIPSFVTYILIIIGLIAFTLAAYLALSGIGLPRIREERSFDLLMLLGTLVLPQLSAFAINIFGWKVPVNAAEVNALTGNEILHMAIIILPIFVISIVLGLWWNRRQWLINAGIWYVIYVVLYTSMFTNGAGFFTGLVGSLGYWLAQQAVNRGDQPIYYYALIQIPVYEFLPAIGSFFAIVLAIMGRKKISDDSIDTEIPDLQPETLSESGENIIPDNLENNQIEEKIISTAESPTLSLLIFWTITSLLAYTVAGEKMPWLTVHITLSMILLSGWSIGYLIDTIDWKNFLQQKGLLTTGLLVVFIPAILSTFKSLLGNTPPFAGKSLDQLAATSEFLIAVVFTLVSGIGIVLLMKNWSARLVRNSFALIFLGMLAVLTARAAFMASFTNYNNATEYLVYAHSGPGDKIALSQITDISKRLTGGLDLEVAYDDKTTYPFWWYLRNFPNQKYYGNTPTRELRDVPIILVGQENFGKIESVVGQAYNEFDYIRIWWPNMDYMNLNPTRIKNAITDPQMRQAIFDIWLNRDYTLYGQITNQDMSLQNWNPSEKLRLYIRKDVVAKLWDYGSTESAAPIQADPYEGKQVEVNADLVIGTIGTEPGQFKNPRDVALAPDGSLYVSDTSNNRIQHLSSDGKVIKVWGTFADISKSNAPGGTFYEPWGIAVGSDGSVYVADTWNHRIQKFSAEGEFLKMWGYFGQAETPLAIWGPRDIAIDIKGNIYVTDTGNKRVVIYDSDGNFINQFGSVGLAPGQFDEPVGIAVDDKGLVYIADTWNQRIQVMSANESGDYLPLISWEVVAWYGQSLDNKPYIAVDNDGNVFATDPEGYRVLHFSSTGSFINYFGDFGVGTNGVNLPTGIISDGKGGLWLVDTGNGRILHYNTINQ